MMDDNIREKIIELCNAYEDLVSFYQSENNTPISKNNPRSKIQVKRLLRAKARVRVRRTNLGIKNDEGMGTSGNHVSDEKEY